MEDILLKITDAKRLEIDRQKQVVAPKELYRTVEQRMAVEADASRRSLRRAITQSQTGGIIAEFKRRSPSLGWIKEAGTPETIPPAYEQAGAAALSILTDEPFFGGSLSFIRRARPLVGLPILRKDFILDEYQLFQAREVGADAVLLIAACLTPALCRSLARTARQLGLEVLLELHKEAELDCLSDDISVTGVNNRNLRAFHTDLDISLRLAALLPPDGVRISESGIHSPEDIRRLRAAGFRGFLMGERFMKADDPGEALRAFIESLNL